MEYDRDLDQRLQNSILTREVGRDFPKPVARTVTAAMPKPAGPIPAPRPVESGPPVKIIVLVLVAIAFVAVMIATQQRDVAIEQIGQLPEEMGRVDGPKPAPPEKTPRDVALEKVAQAREYGADVLVTSGGASMGEFDLFKRVLDDMGFELDFWRVKMRPGTPFSFGHLPPSGGSKRMAVFGLPGNPASSFVTFQILCRPYLLRLSGHHRIHRQVLIARAGEAFRSPPDLTHFFRVILGGDPAFPVATAT